MQRNLQNLRRSDDEAIKEAGLILDFDEIARKGSMSREEMVIAKAYGIYHSRQPGNHMARVVVPGGQLTSVKARALARLASVYSAGRVSCTTRQAAQLHCLKLKELAPLMRDLRAVDMTTFHGCGDDVRNVAACPRASICPHRVLDVLPWSKEISDRLSACRELDNLPRKFKINLSGCEGCCGQPYINCVGLVGVLRRTESGGAEPGFRVVIGGGMGWSPRVARPLYGFVPPKQIVEVCRAIVLLHRDQGDRYVRMYARLKFVVERLGIERCRQIVDCYLDESGVDRTRIIAEPIEDCAPLPPDRPLRDGAVAPSIVTRSVSEAVGDLGSHGLAHASGYDGGGLVIQQIKIPKGELLAEHLARIAELAEMYADKHIYATNRQNLELHGVAPARLPQLRAEIQKLGLETEGFFGLSDVVSCVGTTYCPLAVTSTHAMFDLIQGLVRQEKYAPIADRVLVNITGCPNSCSPYRIVDIGLRGMRIREQTGSTEGYQITVGGTERAFGQVVGEFKQDDCPRVIATILDTFLASCQGDETLADHVARAGVEPYRAAVAALGIRYEMAPNPLELSVVTGRGRTELDRKTLGRDVPCRNACPAKTNIPEYIRHIAHGRMDEAHRINQEDNVLSNILGRICTRPCQDQCRYQWTSVHGPVQICSLKRVAADNKPGPSRPLPPWFPASGRRVAIVGGGPAGLAAARELKRYGHEVTILERESYLGGQVAMGVPAFRLPREAIEEDIAAIIDSGIEVRLGTSVDAGGVDDLCRQYDAVLVAAGANRLMQLELKGLPETLGIEGLRFMKCFNEGAPFAVEGHVVIVGGGFTAVDCARSARRLLGSQGTVRIMYRRGEAQMSATPEELDQMRHEGIRIETLVTPVCAKVAGGRVAAVTFQRNVLSPGSAGKKPAIAPVPGSEFDVPCDTLISAIGQTQDWSVLPEGVKLGKSGGKTGTGTSPIPPLAKPTTDCSEPVPVLPHATTRPGLFVAGDFSSGSGDVIHAVADGKEAADAIDAYLSGGSRRTAHVAIERADPTGRLRDHDLVNQPPMPTLPLVQRGLADEVERGFGPEAAEVHAWRCYLCNHKFEIDQDKCIHCDWCIRVSPRNCILRLENLRLAADGTPAAWSEAPAGEPQRATYIWIDSDQCIRCGNCINICPVGAISLRKCDCVVA